LELPLSEALQLFKKKKKEEEEERKEKRTLHGLSPQANYTDRATAACQRS
jgi:hypothetical protein